MNDQSVSPFKTYNHLKLHIKRQFLSQDQSAVTINYLINAAQGKVIFIVRNIQSTYMHCLGKLLVYCLH
jgi:hypothetical protein